MERTSIRNNTWTEKRIIAAPTRYAPLRRVRHTIGWRPRKRWLSLWLVAATACAVAVAMLPTRPAAPTRGSLYDATEYLYFPEDWSETIQVDSLGGAPEVSPDQSWSEGGDRGGSLDVEPMLLDVKQYRVRRGDTLSGIAHGFGLSLDTVASMNRSAGVGVHRLDIDELIQIPNQDGIFLTVTDLDQQCREQGLLPEAVLRANGITRAELQPPVELFFPGVQHSGHELSLAIGTAFRLPARGWISSRFGPRRDPFTGAWRQHRGVDIAAPSGTRVFATQGGRVAAVGSGGQLGRYVILTHFDGYSSVYAHLSRIYVARGERVGSGEAIGAVGSTGRSTGPHLHFELRRGNIHVDPSDWIPGLR